MHSLRKMVVGKSFYVSLGCQHCMSLDSQVYLDAVFFPRALNDPRVLAQEGWHYEIEKKDDPLTFKGPRHGDLDGIWWQREALPKVKAQNCVCPKSPSIYAVYVHGNGMYQKLLMKLIESLSSWSLSRARCTGDLCEAEPKRHKTDPWKHRPCCRVIVQQKIFQFDQLVLGAAYVSYVTPGVVFNEMKGVYSNPDAAHGRTANQSMFPDNQPLGVLESMGEGESFSMGRYMAQYAAEWENQNFIGKWEHTMIYSCFSTRIRGAETVIFADSSHPSLVRYGVDSGGDPKEIPNLTFDYFKDFHGTSAVWEPKRLGRRWGELMEASLVGNVSNHVQFLIMYAYVCIHIQVYTWYMSHFFVG